MRPVVLVVVDHVEAVEVAALVVVLTVAVGLADGLLLLPPLGGYGYLGLGLGGVDAPLVDPLDFAGGLLSRLPLGLGLSQVDYM